MLRIAGVASLNLVLALAVVSGQRTSFADDAGIPLDHPDFNFPLRKGQLVDVETDVVKWLAEEPADNSWLVFLTDQSGSDGGTGFAQLSVKQGRLGVDHVMNIDRHYSLEQKFRAFANSEGYEVADLIKNGVRYLRFHTDDPVDDVVKVLKRVHGVDDRLVLYTFGRVEASED